MYVLASSATGEDSDKTFLIGGIAIVAAVVVAIIFLIIIVLLCRCYIKGTLHSMYVHICKSIHSYKIWMQIQTPNLQMLFVCMHSLRVGKQDDLIFVV